MIPNHNAVSLIILLGTATLLKGLTWENKNGRLEDKMLEVPEATVVPFAVFQFKASQPEVTSFKVTGETEDKIKISNDGWLYLEKALDRELKQSHSIQIEALDESSQTVEGPVTVTIIVKDINDNRPVFSQSEYAGVVREHSVPGDPFLQVFATDMDDPNTPNARLNFTISNQIPDHLKTPMFQINAATGEISTTPEGAAALKASKVFMFDKEEDVDKVDHLRKKFDEYCIPKENIPYERNPFFTCVQQRGAARLDPQIAADYTLIITVRDLEGLSESALSGSTRVNIVVKENLWVAPSPITIKENSTEQHPVQITQVQWNEPGAIYTLAQKEKFPRFPFSIDPAGRIYVTEPLDWEEKSRYGLVVFVRDENMKELDRPLEIHVIVEDINDNPPVCVHSESLFEVQENENIGNKIGVLQVTDLDEEGTENSLLHYEILNQEPELPSRTMFTIDEYSGNIQIAHGQFEKNEVPEYRLRVKVSDNGGRPAGFSTECKLVIKVIDINNQIPIFEKSQYEPVSTPEDTPSGTTLLSILANDADEPGTGSSKVEYSIANGDPGKHFAIETNGTTNRGYLYIIKPLDFEKQSQYHLQINARNPEPLVSGIDYNSSSSALVIIEVTDVNEAPEFNKTGIYQTIILEDIANGTTILQVQAKDPEDDAITYTLLDDSLKWLRINEKTGDIITAASLDFEKMQEYVVRVRAEAGEPKQMSEQQVFIKLKDVNDNVPTLSKESLSAIICYPVEQSQKPLMLVAEDPDLPPYGSPLTFSLGGNATVSNDWKIKAFNETSAELIINHRNVHQQDYKVPIRIKDAGDRENTQTFTVHICKCTDFGNCFIEPGAHKEKAYAGTAVALLVGVLGFIAVILAVVLYRIKKKNPKKKSQNANGPAETELLSKANA
ncbi:cadherin-17 [Lepisosteus oculatus]|uniref:cadherin-17 n=1 Tax=Lepisosteus oculatus TaxID=7918 RepID=UPI0035F51C09